LFKRNEEFDIVIFDEASQIFIEKSLPGINRAKKLVVLGDEKQLGPSNFFDGRIDKEDEEIENDESLLTFAKAKFPTVMLRNHYRSEHVSLIEFSNENYYNDELIFIDKNINKKQQSAVEFIHVNNSQYSNSVNDREATVVVEKLLEKFNSKSKNTIGIITTNVKQADLIEDKILNQELTFRD
jgi:superfamily I DNA and/or RNA helicase